MIDFIMFSLRRESGSVSPGKLFRDWSLAFKNLLIDFDGDLFALKMAGKKDSSNPLHTQSIDIAL